ncbi:MAG TPA: PIN domain-containing protein [Polyangiaceae bacterium]|nr:PIN domain-containing protein [Polyangiaceae bacterium]
MRGNGVVLDAGAFIALERRNRVMVHLAQRFAESGTPLVTSAGVVAQVWRGGGQRQVPVAFLLRHAEVVDLTNSVARILGRMLGAVRRSDPVDAHVVLLAREREWPVISSDPDDLLAIDPTLAIERV